MVGWAQGALYGVLWDRSHKGSAFALIVELLGGAFAGGAVLDKDNAKSWGNLVIAIQPGIMGSAEAFKQRVTDLCARVKGARRAPGVTEVRLPGERSSQLAGDLHFSADLQLSLPCCQIWSCQASLLTEILMYMVHAAIGYMHACGWSHCLLDPELSCVQARGRHMPMASTYSPAPLEY